MAGWRTNARALPAPGRHDPDGAHDVVRTRAPEVRQLPVVALRREALLGVTADDAVDHQPALRGERDDVADLVLGPPLGDREVAGVERRLHAARRRR